MVWVGYYETFKNNVLTITLMIKIIVVKNLSSEKHKIHCSIESILTMIPILFFKYKQKLEKDWKEIKETIEKLS